VAGNGGLPGIGQLGGKGGKGGEGTINGTGSLYNVSQGNASLGGKGGNGGRGGNGGNGGVGPGGVSIGILTVGTYVPVVACNSYVLRGKGGVDGRLSGNTTTGFHYACYSSDGTTFNCSEVAQTCDVSCTDVEALLNVSLGCDRCGVCGGNNSSCPYEVDPEEKPQETPPKIAAWKVVVIAMGTVFATVAVAATVAYLFHLRRKNTEYAHSLVLDGEEDDPTYVTQDDFVNVNVTKTTGQNIEMKDKTSDIQ